MAEILPGVHQVEGVDPLPDFTTHVYLVRDKGPTWTLIDTGLPGSDRAILAYLQKHKIEPGSIRTILITHLHLDHTGNLKKMIEHTKARTYAHWLDAAFIAMDPPYDGPVISAERTGQGRRAAQGRRSDRCGRRARGLPHSGAHPGPYGLL